MHPTFKRLMEAAAQGKDDQPGPAEVGRRVGESEQTMSNWKTRGVPKAKHIGLALTLGISPLWLAEGTGMMRPITEATEPSQDFVPVARVLLKLEAGVTGYQVQQLEGDGPPIFFRRDFLASKGWRAERLFALRICGDSMEPALFAGDLVVVNTAETEPLDGEVFAVNYEGQAVIKRLRRDAGEWWLDSDNQRHKPKRCDEHALLLGRVCYRQTERI
jgi:phage repressor protein C with HTH and peptisase S24 domain